MKRRLNESRIGEYKGNLILNIIYTIVNIVSIVGLFIAPIHYSGVISFPEFVKASSVNYLIDNGFNNALSYFALSLVLLFGVTFINSYLSFSISKLGKSVYIKIAKIIEIVMVIVSLISLSFALYNMGGDFFKQYLIIYFSWQCLLICVLIVALLNYFKIKKISIYD